MILSVLLQESGWGGGVMVAVFVLGLIALGLWIFALVDIVKNQFPGFWKAIWLVVVIFFPMAGAILYFLLGRPQRKFSNDL